MKDDIVRGTCDGTGAKINVCLGFIPRKVEIFNIDSANLEQLVWDKEMGLVASYANEGILKRTASSADASSKLAVSSTTQQGVREYAGGTKLNYDGTTNNRWEDESGNDASEVYVDGKHSKDAATDDAYKCVGDALSPDPTNGAAIHTPAGFSIGANGNLNVNGEQLVWIAYR